MTVFTRRPSADAVALAEARDTIAEAKAVNASLVARNAALEREADVARQALTDADATIAALTAQGEAWAAYAREQQARLVVERDEAMEIAVQHQTAHALADREYNATRTELDDLQHAVELTQYLTGKAIGWMAEGKVMALCAEVIASGRRAAPQVIGPLITGYSQAKDARRATPAGGTDAQ